MNIRDIVRSNKKKEKKKKKKSEGRIRYNDLYKDLTPRTGYAFYSDYFRIDGAYATILTLIYDELSDRNLPTFWGIQLIPNDLGRDIMVRRFTHVARKGESWISNHQIKAEKVSTSEENQTQDMTRSLQVQKRRDSLLGIADELSQGSSYLDTAVKYFIKAPSLNKLDDAVEKVNRQMKDRFNSIQFHPIIGEQSLELTHLMGKTDSQLGPSMMFTSKEFAGYYDLVTHGIEDEAGEYIGFMTGDVNNSAVLMDLDDYDSHVVLAGNNKAETVSQLRFRKERGVNMIGAKLGMSALMNNKRVVHLVLNGSKVGNIGVDLSDITSTVSMDVGDINFLEIFGQKDEELVLFPAHLQKIILMYKQIAKGNSEIEDIIDGLLKDTLTDFYVDKHMWTRNAQKNRERLRLVGLDHKDVPTLPDLVTYLRQRYHSASKSSSADQDTLRAYNVLVQVFRSMLEDNGDLFDTTTNSAIDKAQNANRVIYDFSSLIRRGRQVMMAQFVNALTYSVMQLEGGDVVILHGADYLTPELKDYVKEQFSLLAERDVRVVYIYHDIETMIDDRRFNQFDLADYTFIGSMSASMIDKYEEGIKQPMPKGLKNLLVNKTPTRYYLRRGLENLVLDVDFRLGV